MRLCSDVRTNGVQVFELGLFSVIQIPAQLPGVKVLLVLLCNPKQLYRCTKCSLSH